jgi:hypothetical protein
LKDPSRAVAWGSTNLLEGGDAELITRLLAPRAGEAEFIAPAASTRGLTSALGEGEFHNRACRPLNEGTGRRS